MRIRNNILSLFAIFLLLIMFNVKVFADGERGKIVDIDPSDEKIIVLYENGDVGLAFGTEKENAEMKEKLGKCKKLMGASCVVRDDGTRIYFSSYNMRIRDIPEIATEPSKIDGLSETIKYPAVPGNGECEGFFYLLNDGKVEMKGDSIFTQEFSTEVGTWKDIISVSATNDTVFGLDKEGIMHFKSHGVNNYNYEEFFTKLGKCKKMITVAQNLYFLSEAGDFGVAGKHVLSREVGKIVQSRVIFKNIDDFENGGFNKYSRDVYLITNKNGEKRIFDPMSRFDDEVVSGGAWLKNVAKAKMSSAALYVLTTSGKIMIYGNPNGHGYVLPRGIFIKKVESYITRYGDKGKCIITNNGEVIFDENRYIPSSMKNIKDIVASRWGTAALREDGTVVCTGEGGMVGYEYTFDWETLNGVKNVASLTGNNTTVALVMEDGHLRVWNSTGEIPIPKEIESVKKVSVGSRTILVLRKDGKVFEIEIKEDGQTQITEKASDISDVFNCGGVVGIIDTAGNVTLEDRFFQYGDTAIHNLSNVAKILIPANNTGQLVNIYPIYYIDKSGVLRAWLCDKSNQYYFDDLKYPAEIPNVRDAIFAGSNMIVLKDDGTLEYYGRKTLFHEQKYDLSSVSGQFISLFDTVDGVGALRGDGTAITIGAVNDPMNFKIYDTSDRSDISSEVEYVAAHSKIGPIGCSQFNISQTGKNVYLSWNKIEDVDSYIITYALGKKTFTMETSSTSTIIKGLEKSKTYTFSIQSKNSLGISRNGKGKKYKVQ